MQDLERSTLVAPCGIDCGICELHICKDNPQLYGLLLSRGIPKDRIPCRGCRNIDGNCPVIKSTCDTFVCVQEKKVQFCYKCGEFPCAMLHPSVDRAEVIPHNMKVFNLCTIERSGVDGFIRESVSIKLKYYKGKMEVGKGPQLRERKGLFDVIRYS